MPIDDCCYAPKETEITLRDEKQHLVKSVHICTAQSHNKLLGGSMFYLKCILLEALATK